MMISDKITIITVCRNAAASIRQTIESVISQKQGKNVEYIVIDGASTDGTQEIVKSFGNAVDIFISEPDRGIADAFNKGIIRSSGTIVGLINADDRLLPGVIDNVIYFFAAHSDIDVIHGDVHLYEGSHFIKRVCPAGRWWYPWRLVLFNHPTTFVRRNIYEKYGLFDTSYQIAMDVEIFLRWQSHGVKIKYLHEVFANVMCGGLSGQCAAEGSREARNAFLHYEYSSILVNVQLAGKLLINRILTIGSR
jgi:glycosyltransferase involved in cell wall biosynthesis